MRYLKNILRVLLLLFFLVVLYKIFTSNIEIKEILNIGKINKIEETHKLNRIEIQNLQQQMDHVLENDNGGKTYYISENGTSMDGTDINDPMSFSTANTKTYYGNDRILFKSGDIFYGVLNFDIRATNDEYVVISSYGDGDRPIISGANILINSDAWIIEDDLYKIDLSITNNFEGIGNIGREPYNIGFLADEYGKIYGNRKASKEEIEDEFDFYCENNYLYLSCTENPSEKLGKIKFVAKNNLVNLSSNTIFDNIIVQYTGAHGIVNKNSDAENVYIRNCIVENIGGSVLRKDKFSRYGNAIQFWNKSNNCIVKNCIIRDVYDAGFTIQGSEVVTGFKNTLVEDNIFIRCTYSLEMFCRNDANGDEKITIGYDNCIFDNNIFINQGKGWGLQGRADFLYVAENVIWNLMKNKTSISLSNNKYYNSKRIYYNTANLSNYKNAIKIDNNDLFLANSTYLHNSHGNYYDRSIFEKYYINENSKYRLISDIEIDKISNSDILGSNDYEEIKSYYENLEVQFDYTDVENEIIEKYKEKQVKYANNENISNLIQMIINDLEDIRDGKSIINVEEIQEFIENNYAIINNELDKKGAELVEIIKDIDEVVDGYAKLFELNSVNDVYGIDGLNAKIDNTNALLYYYENKIETSDIEELILLAVEHYSTDSVIGYIKCEYIIDIVNKLITMRADEYNLQSVFIEYSTTEITNQDVVAKLVSSSEEIEMPYGDTYTFTDNGVFAFKYVYKGEEKEIVAAVNWIDRIYPEFVGIDDRIDETDSVTINIYDENLDTVVATRDGQVIQFNNGDTLIEVGSYTATAKDKAGNTTIAEFRIVDYIDSNKYYYIAPNGNGDGLSANSPMSVNDASKIRYYAGDKILFKSGERYNVDLNWHMVGAKEKTVTISSYGAGNMPIINGSIELVSNLNISGLRFTNSRESCLVTNQLYCENIAIFECIFENIEDTAIYLNKQVSNININNCIFRNCGVSGIALKNDDKSFVAKDVFIQDNMFIGIDNGITISGKFLDEIFENVQICNNYFINQSGDEAIISYGNVVDTKFDVKVFNNFYYNFENGYSVVENSLENLKNNLVSDNNTWYALDNSKLLNECTDFEILQNDYNLERNSKFVVMNTDSYQVELVGSIAEESDDKDYILMYMFEAIRLSSSNKKVQDIDVESGVVTVSSGYEEFISSKVGSTAELDGKNSQEKVADMTVAEEALPLAGWKKIAFGIVAVALICFAISAYKNAVYWSDTKKQLKK